ncbi:MAG: hypothetical protein R6X29_01290 [Acidimicrobiia bacterium]|jgi:hypothetical protein
MTDERRTTSEREVREVIVTPESSSSAGVVLAAILLAGVIFLAIWLFAMNDNGGAAGTTVPDDSGTPTETVAPGDDVGELPTEPTLAP